MRLGKLFLLILLVCGAINAEEKVKLNFKDMEIRKFVEMVAKITNKNILIQTNISGKVNFIAQKPVEKSELMPLAISILETKGFTIVKSSDGVWKVVKSSMASGSGLEVSQEGDVDGDLLQTTVFKLKNVSSATINSKIRLFLSKRAKTTYFKKNNLLVITDYPKAIESVRKVIELVEKDEKKVLKFVELRYAKARDIYTQVNTVAQNFFNKKIEIQKTKVIMDSNTNALILIGRVQNVAVLEDLITKLDVEDKVSRQKMFIIELKNSSVEQMEKILSNLISKNTNILSSKTKRKNKNTKEPSRVITSDLERNALVILETPEKFAEIKKIVELLDVEKPQVYVKARIVEISNNMASQIGLKYGLEGGRVNSGGLYTLGTQLGGPSVAVSGAISSYLQMDTVKEGLAIGLSLSLLRTDGAANILSEPTILCTNNKESSIYVGKTQSILKSSTSGDNATDLTRNSYSREDIGLTLKVKPRLTVKNKVILDIATKIEDIDSSSASISDRPTTLKRQIKTTATVQNGETIILGGLMKSSEGIGTSKVPLLSDIPLIGNLFTYKSKTEDQVSIVIYITPYIIPTSSNLKEIRRLLSELNLLQSKYNKRAKSFLLNRKNGYNHGNNGGKSGDS